MKKIVTFIFLLLLAVTLNAQNNKAGTIAKITNAEVIIKHETPDAPFQIGDKLHLLTGDPGVVLEVTFPMQSSSKCRLRSGSSSKLKIGMVVVSGASVKDDGRKTAAVKVQGKDEKYTIAGVPFILKNARVPEGGITFPIGVRDEATARIENPFLIAQTDTTYQLWKEVYNWATSNYKRTGKRKDGGVLYVFANAGQNGTDGTNDANGFSTSISTQYPVTKINWRDAIVWCNALTEYYNANNGRAADLAVVYCSDAAYTMPIRTSTNSDTITATTAGSQDDPYVNASAKGFRLPTSMEYEFAARYIGTTVPAHTNVVQKDGVYYTNGASASGAMGDYTNDAATMASAVIGAKSNDDIFMVTKVTSTAVVKSKAPNALGLYDMSGNVWKWNFDWLSSYVSSSRVQRGGVFCGFADYAQTCFVCFSVPYNVREISGFRFARSY